MLVSEIEVGFIIKETKVNKVLRFNKKALAIAYFCLLIIFFLYSTFTAFLTPFL